VLPLVSGFRQLALLFHLGLRGQSISDQPERLADHGLIDCAQVDSLQDAIEPVDYRRAFAEDAAGIRSRAQFPAFCACLLAAASIVLPGKSLVARRLCSLRWFVQNCARRAGTIGSGDWPIAIHPHSRKTFEFDDLQVRSVVQFFEQWQALRAYCAQRSIRTLGTLLYSSILTALMSDPP
jgi:hypothetical protein